MSAEKSEGVEIRDLHVWFKTPRGIVKAVDGVSFDISPGRVTALVGESGCGKTVSALALTRLLPEPPAFYPRGEIRVGGVDVLAADRKTLRSIRGGRIGYVFQDPGSALNPVLTVGRQVSESAALHRPGMDPGSEAVESLRLAGLADGEALMSRYPHELSGGMKQRVVIAMALAAGPGILVADEPTTALDVTIQARILELLAELRKRLGMGVLLITHNLALVAELAETVNVMYAGRIVESGPARCVLRSPAHPYTAALLRAVPRLSSSHGTRARLGGIPGRVPDPRDWPAGCRFAGRCAKADDRCRRESPPESLPEPGRRLSCFHPEEEPE
jgi:oligopeptide/dipeptide ABC transporter ATP-binding protein